jgi:hypothetical protein
MSKVSYSLHLRVPDLDDTPPTIYHLAGIPRWAWRFNTDTFFSSNGSHRPSRPPPPESDELVCFFLPPEPPFSTISGTEATRSNHSRRRSFAGDHLDAPLPPPPPTGCLPPPAAGGVPPPRRPAHEPPPPPATGFPRPSLHSHGPPLQPPKP